MKFSLNWREADLMEVVCCTDATKNPFIVRIAWKTSTALVQYMQPSEFGGWLSVQAGGLHRKSPKLFFKLWRNSQ
jgi:hypothetical protein